MESPTKNRCADLKPQIEEVVLDNISVFADGVVGLTGRVMWTLPVESDEVRLWLRVVRRGTEGRQDTFCRLSPARGNDSQFGGQLDLHQFLGHQEDVLDVYAVIRNSTDEATFRLAWPQAYLPWMAYPTMYGNLSIKRSKAKVTNRDQHSN